MLFRSLLTFFLLTAFGTVLAASPLPPVNYTLRFPDAMHHYVEVEADLPTDGAATLTVFMPVWTPGSYLVREYSRYIDRIVAATPDRHGLPIAKVAKNRWEITTQGHDRVRVSYRLYGWEADVRSNWIEHNFAMLNGGPTYLTVTRDFQRPYTVRVELPAGWAGSYTPLEPGAQPHTYSAPDYDTLVDSPLLAGTPQVDEFAIDGVPHFLVTVGGDGVWDNARAARSLARILQTERTFWGGLPYTRPYYVFNLLSGSRGGLEHKQAFVLTADRWLTRTRSGINSWLSLCAHEYFHTWNVKRLRPAALGPFDYENEAYTKSLWIAEGFTNYYQQLMLLRAGYHNRKDTLGDFSATIAAIENNPGRLVQSLEESSFDAWIKAYRPDENTVNTQLSYYSGGALAGLLLDAEIRRCTGGAKSLDDVMRAAYARYSGAHGYTEAEFFAVASAIAGQDLTPWFHRVVQTPGAFDYQPMLDWYGLRFAGPEKPKPDPQLDPLEPPDPEPGWLGLETNVREGRLLVTLVRDGTPAAAAGLDPRDELLAINGFRILTPPPLTLPQYRPGDRVDLLVARQDHLITLPVTLGQKPAQTWRLESRPDATPEQKAHLISWLGED
ncbi:MAG: M61 family metallopeptidase, partial [Opitutales bacterium]